MAAISFVLSLVLIAADESKPRLDPALKAKVSTALDKGVAYLRQHQREDGSYGDGEFGPPVTAFITAAFLSTGRVGLSDPLAAKGLKNLEQFIRADGSIHADPGRLKTIPTAVALMAFVEANQDGRYQTVIDKGVAYLKTEQGDESKGMTPSDPKYGGFGYGNNSRPDLGSTAFMLEAMKNCGLPDGDPAFQRAVHFVTRCQNLAGEGASDQPIAAKINDGGFFYTMYKDDFPAGGNLQDGINSYGSMTYSGLMCLAFADLPKDDRRVVAAANWIKKRYTLEENPGVGLKGHYYYLHTYSKTMRALRVDRFEDASGVNHDWRTELAEALVKRQRDDGSWINTDSKWMETDARIVTAYALLSFANILKK